MYDWRNANEKDRKPQSDETSFGDEYRTMEQSFQDGDGEEACGSVQQEGIEAGEARPDEKFRGSFTVKEITEHEDGSATLEIDGTKEDMQTLFQAMFLEALRLGCKAANSNTGAWVAEREALRIAEKLVKYLDVWEECDELDYSPSVKEVKESLKSLLRKIKLD